MALTKITIPELLDFPNDSTASANTSGTVIPTGVTGDRPTPIDGEFRFNTTLGYIEYWEGSTWLQIADEYITGQPTTCICNYPTTAANLWEFNDDVTDTCDNNNGTSINPTYSAGEFGKAYDFSVNTATYGGTSSYITYSDMSKANDFTWSFWIYAGSTPTQYATIVSFLGTYYNALTWDTSFTLYYYNGVGADYDTGIATGITAGNWNHIALTKDSSNGSTIYVNDSVIYTNSVYTNAGSGVLGVSSIGMHASTGSNWAYPLDGDCLIDQFRVYNTVLSSTQITELYNEVVCN